jgi:hypothetical protein
MKKLSTQNIILGAIVIGGGWYFWNKSKQNKELAKEVDITPEETPKDTSKESTTDLSPVDTGGGYRSASTPVQTSAQNQPVALQYLNALTSATGVKKPNLSKIFSAIRKRRKGKKRRSRASVTPLTSMTSSGSGRGLFRRRRNMSGTEDDNVLF